MQVKKIASEFIGTFVLVFAVGANTASGASGTWAALSIASALMVSIYALGSVSGAHFNPAVSVGYYLSGEDKSYTITDMQMYILTQLTAGAVAGFLSRSVVGEGADLQPGAGYSYGGAMATEAIYTFMLVFVVLRAAVIVQFEYFGLAIGFVIVAAGYAAGGISGAALNPAVAFGLDIASGESGRFYWAACYSGFELVGAVAAAMAHLTIGKGDYKMGTKMFSEFLGTFMLVLTVGLNVTGGSPAGALSIGASLMCMIYALGGVSGANFNPAVSVTLWLTKYLDSDSLVPYIVAQLLGGFTAGLTYVSLTDMSVPLTYGEGYGWVSCGFAEFIATFVLCFVVVNAACSASGKTENMYGLAIGFVIVSMGNAIGAVSGGSLNPAVSFGLDMSNYIKTGEPSVNCLAYSAFELAGAAAAYGAYRVCRDAEYAKLK